MKLTLTLTDLGTTTTWAELRRQLELVIKHVPAYNNVINPLRQVFMITSHPTEEWDIVPVVNGEWKVEGP